MNKIPSEVTHIDLLDASYQETGAYIEPTYVNFFFGNNGTGKSTIARALKNGVGITYAPGRNASEYLTLVFDQEFIDENVRKYRGLDGVFTLNSKNDQVQKQIDEQMELRKKTKEDMSRDSEALSKKQEAKTKLKRDFYKEAWDKEKAFREEFPKTQTGKG